MFATIERAAAAVPGFEVKHRVILANFQFAKMAMVEDLRKNGDAIASSAVVAAIAGHSSSRRKLAEAVIDVEPAQLDERPASDDYLVLDADSTQQRAVVLVGITAEGGVQGPRNGKSRNRETHRTSVAEGRRACSCPESGLRSMQ